MVKSKKKEKPVEYDESKLFAFLAVFLSIVGFIIAVIVKPKDKYVMYYAKQSLVLFIVFVIAGVLGMILAIIPIIGYIIYWIIYLACVILWIISWLYALSGEKKEVPFIGQYARKIKL